MGTRSGAASIIDIIGTNMQSKRVNPSLRTPGNLSGMFEEVAPATAEQIASRGVGEVNSLVSNIARSNPSYANRVAPRLFSQALRTSNNARLSILGENRGQRRAKYKYLADLDNFNIAETNRADEATRNVINKGIGATTKSLTDYLSRSSALDANRFEFNSQAKKQFNDNASQIDQNRLDATAAYGSYQSQMGLDDTDRN